MSYSDLDTALGLLNTAISTTMDGDQDDNPQLSALVDGDTTVVSSPANAADLASSADAVAAASAQSANPVAAPREITGLPAWLFPPSNAEPFDPAGVLATPGDNAEHTVLTLTVPQGWDGVIRRLSHNFTGPGFQEGFLIWRLLRNGGAVRNYDNIQIEFGSIAQPRQTDGIRVFSGDVITYVVLVPAGTGFIVPGNSNIVCTLGGYWWPKH